MASFLLAATGVVASFLGDNALESGVGVWEALALATLAVGVVCGINH